METVEQIPKYNLNEEQEKKLILREYRSLLRSLKAKIKPGDKDNIRRAFEMSADAHKTMRRKSGEPRSLWSDALKYLCLGQRPIVEARLLNGIEDPLLHVSVRNQQQHAKVDASISAFGRTHAKTLLYRQLTLQLCDLFTRMPAGSTLRHGLCC